MKYYLFLMLYGVSLLGFAAERSMIPSADKIKTAKSLILEVVSDQVKSYKARQITADKLADAIFQLMKDAEQPETEYTILNMAQDFYLESRSYEKAIEMLELRQEMFVDTDISNGTLQILSLWLKNVSPKDYDAALMFFNQKFETAIVENNLDAAESLYKLILPLAMKF